MPVLVKICPVVLRKISSIFSQHVIRDHLPLEHVALNSFEKLESPSPKDVFAKVG